MAENWSVISTEGVRSAEQLQALLNKQHESGFTGETIVVPTASNDPSVYIAMRKPQVWR